jgi:hypothetical protein
MHIVVATEFTPLKKVCGINVKKRVTIYYKNSRLRREEGHI